jgi:hypothetical protein
MSQKEAQNFHILLILLSLSLRFFLYLIFSTCLHTFLKAGQNLTNDLEITWTLFRLPPLALFSSFDSAVSHAKIRLALVMRLLA